MPSPNNLPLQLSSFVGREREICEVKRLLSTSRLLTLTGAGGSGKTRLALQTASQLVGEYPSGVFFVNLAPITDHNLVVSAMAQTLSVKEVAGQPLIETMKAYLQNKELLLFLDNFEQVLEAAPFVVCLLLTAPLLKVLVTSREPLHVQGEQQFLVPPLSLPDPAHSADPIALSQYEADMLFVQRAQTARADFRMTRDNALSIAEICVHLDGLPLAIELAAARISMLPPRAMILRLNSRLNLLSRGAHDLPARQQTLRNTLDWSYDLLTDDEKHLFRRLAAFMGGRTLQGIEEVCNADGRLVPDVEEGVESLLDKNLLQQRAGRDGEPRFWMLETIHEYAREKWEESGEVEAIKKQHALYFMRLAERAEPELQGPKVVEWLDKLEDEHDNIRAALLWARQSASIETGLRLAGAVWRFWLLRGYSDEGREQLASLLSVRDADTANVPPVLQVPLPVRAKALNGAGYLAWGRVDLPSARPLYEESLAIYQALGDRKNIALCLNNLGLIIVSYDSEAGKRLFEESLAIRRDLNDTLGVAASLNNLAFFAMEERDYLSAYTLFQESLELSQQIGNKAGIASAHVNLASLARHEGNYSLARTHYEESMAIWQELGDRFSGTHSTVFLGILALEQGDYAGALLLLREALQLYLELEDKAGMFGAIWDIAWWAASQQMVERAARLWGAVTALCESNNFPPPGAASEAYQTMDAVRKRSDPILWRQAWQEGGAMSMHQAIAYALEDAAEPVQLNEVTSPETPPELSATLPSTAPMELTKREVEVLRLLVEALSNDQIAHRLFLSRNTVTSHLYSIYGKLNVSSRSAAARFAVEHNLV